MNPDQVFSLFIADNARTFNPFIAWNSNCADMPLKIAFLRGINVGGHRIKMDRLGGLFEELGLAGVSTYLASGNVVFESNSEDASMLEAEIERHLLESLGYEVDTFIRSFGELAILNDLDLFPAADDPENRLHVLFLRASPGEDAAGNLRQLETDDDRLRLRGRELFWLRRGRMSDSEIGGPDLLRAVGADSGTMRNMNTVRRMVAKFSD